MPLIKNFTNSVQSLVK